MTKIFKLVVLSLLIAGLVACLSTCFNFYFDFPTYTDISMVEQGEALFPAVTICPDTPAAAKEDVLAENGIGNGNGTSACAYHGRECQKNLSWHSLTNKYGPQELFEKATYTLNDLLAQIRVRLAHPLNDSYDFFYTDPYPGLYITEQRRRPHLRCWTIALPPNDTKHNHIYYIRYQLKLPIKYYIHKVGQFLNLNGKMPLRFSTGTRQEVQVSTWDMQLLHDAYVKRNCQHDDITFDDCLYNALEYHMRENTTTNCTVPWTRNNSRICSNPKDVETAFSISWNRGTNQMRDCLKPCHSLEISTTSNVTPNPSKTSKSYLSLYFQVVVTKSEEKRLYGWRNLFAEIGGYVGIFLGYSFLTLMDLCAWAYQVAIKRFAKEQHLPKIP